MNAQTDSKLNTCVLFETSIQISHGIEDTQACPYGSLGVIFMGLGIAKVDQEPIPEELGKVSCIALDDVSAHLLIRMDHVPIVFGVELGGELRRVHQVTEHDGELTAFRVRSAWFEWWCDLRRLIMLERRQLDWLGRWRRGCRYG